MLVTGVIVLGLVVTSAWAAPRAVRRIGDRFDRVTGRDDLKVLERDAVLAFRAPGTTLRRTERTRRYAGSPGRQYEPATVEQHFAVEGDPVAALEAYRGRAEADGWQLVRSQCSPYRRGAAVSLTKSTPIPAVLTVRTVMAGAPMGGGLAPGAATTAGPVLTLTLTAQGHLDHLGAGAWPLGDIGCLRSIDPEDPAFKVRPGPVRTPAELCAHLPVDRARRIVPEVTVATPTAPDHLGRGGCTYEQRPYAPPSPWLPAQARIDSRTWFSVVDAGGFGLPVAAAQKWLLRSATS